MAKPESRLQRNIRRQLVTAVGGHWYKIWGGPYQKAGIPDLLGCVNGLFFGLEVKQPGKGKKSKPSDLQKIEIELIQLAGGCAGVVTSPEEAIELVSSTIARAKRRR
jgi:hypothetical protein